MTARNPSPFTFHGTNSYLVGEHELAVIDPGPENDEHFDALIGADCRPAGHAHPRQPHASRSFAARRTAEQGHRRTGLCRGAAPSGQESADRHAARQRRGYWLSCRISRWRTAICSQATAGTLRTVLTPGHTANHAAFALEGTGLLFSADHVMAWSTTIVAPPDGSMADYMASLDRLIERDDRHPAARPWRSGEEPARLSARPEGTRLARERAILDRLTAGRPVDRRTGQGDISRHRSENARRRSAFRARASRRPGRPETGRRPTAHRQSGGSSDRSSGSAGSRGAQGQADGAGSAGFGGSVPRFDRSDDGQIGDLDVEVGQEECDAGGIVAEIMRTVPRRRAHVDVGGRVLVDQAYGNVGGKSQQG